MRYSADGENISPPLKWSAGPSSTQCYVLIVEDPDATSGTYIHWVLFNIPSNITALPEGIAKKPVVPGFGIHGANSARRAEYYGPLPPPGKPHHYFFRLFALDRLLEVSPGSPVELVRKAMEGHILESCQLMGIYQR
jgi:Raf kinase inhibitor-like YbhB/YbcL family protein